MFAQDDMITGFSKRKEKAVAELNEKTQKDTARVNALVNVFSQGVFNKQRIELLPYYNEALALSKALNYKAGLAACYLFKGNLLNGEKKITEARQLFDSAIIIGKKTKDERLLKYVANAHQSLAMSFQLQELIHKALYHHFESLKYFEEKDSTKAMYVYGNMTDLYNRANNAQSAILFAKKNIAYAENSSSISLKVQAYLNMAMTLSKQNLFDDAFDYLKKAQVFVPVPNEHYLNSAYFIQTGEYNFMKQRYDSALQYYQKAYQIVEDATHNFNQTSILFHLSTTALKLGKVDLAKEYADKNMATALKLGAKAGKINALQNLADYYKARGDASKAYYYLQQAYDLKDSLTIESNNKQLNNLAAVYEFEEKERSIVRLQSEKEAQSAAAKRKNLINYFLLMAIAAALGIGYIIQANFKKDKQLYKQQQILQEQKIIELEKDKQLSTISAMLKGQEEERGRIAKDLHDGVGSLLSGTKLAFINIRERVPFEREDAVRFDKSLSMLDNTILDIRKVAQNLMPEALARFGLYDAVQDFCDYIRNSTGVAVIYQVFGNKRKLNSTADIYIYRIIQELVNNAIKHSEASEIVIQLVLNDGKIAVTVEDNGKGFNKEKAFNCKGAGFANIEYRVKQLNGISDIISTPGNGTSASIELMI